MKTVFRLARLLRPYWKHLVITLLAALGDTASGLLQPWPLKVVFDNVFHSKQNLTPAVAHLVTAVFGSGHVGILYFALAAVLSIAVLSSISTFTENFVMVRVANWVLYDLRRRLYWHIQRLSLSYHDERRVGELNSTLIGDIQVVQDMIANGVLDFVVSVLTLVGMAVVMVAINWRFALLALSITPFLFV
ncbi:MAG TPA: ABC transporter transmembrane domain-containing protein, partial [Chloroflexota bacterium]|nr:ABC transporter transmembrane domain-containing protein [Chloroflexota bacterium]